MMSGGMEAQNDFAARWTFQAQALCADGDATVAADLDDRAHAPDIIPPRATGHGSQFSGLRKSLTG